MKVERLDIKVFSSLFPLLFLWAYTYTGTKTSIHSYIPVNERCRRQGVKLGTFSEWWVLSCVFVCIYLGGSGE